MYYLIGGWRGIASATAIPLRDSQCDDSCFSSRGVRQVCVSTGFGAKHHRVGLTRDDVASRRLSGSPSQRRRTAGNSQPVTTRQRDGFCDEHNWKVRCLRPAQRDHKMAFHGDVLAPCATCRSRPLKREHKQARRSRNVSTVTVTPAVRCADYRGFSRYSASDRLACASRDVHQGTRIAFRDTAACSRATSTPRCAGCSSRETRRRFTKQFEHE